MRLAGVLGCVVVTCAVVSGAFAQGGPPVKFTPPAGIKSTIPVLTGVQLDLVANAKVAALASWGLTVTKANLRPSYWVTPQAAANPNGATLVVRTTSAQAANYGAAGVFPYGSIPLNSTPTGSDMIGISNVPATARDWFLVECFVSSGPAYQMNAPQPGPPGHPGAVADISYRDLVADSRPKVAALFAPTTQARRSFEVHRISAPGTEADWRFGGCEVTPVQL